MTLMEALQTLDYDILLSDGEVTWSVENLIDILADYEDSSEYVIDVNYDGKTQVVRLNKNGYQMVPPVYSEV